MHREIAWEPLFLRNRKTLPVLMFCTTQGDAQMKKFLSAVLAAGLIAGVSGMASAEGMKKNDSMHKSNSMMKKDQPGTVTPRTTGSSGTSKPTAAPQTTPAQPMGKGSNAETPKK